jgi:transcriptional regulator with XRE-family HTH domain
MESWDERRTQGLVIKMGREITGLTLHECGKLAGVSGGTLSNIERGQVKPRRGTLKQIRSMLVDHYGITVIYDKTNRTIGVTKSYDPPNEWD